MMLEKEVPVVTGLLFWSVIYIGRVLPQDNKEDREIEKDCFIVRLNTQNSNSITEGSFMSSWITCL